MVQLVLILLVLLVLILFFLLVLLVLLYEPGKLNQVKLHKQYKQDKFNQDKHQANLSTETYKISPPFIPVNAPSPVFDK